MPSAATRWTALPHTFSAPVRSSNTVSVLEVTLEPNDEEPVHHHRWPSVFVLDQIKPPVVDISPNGERLPPNRDVIKALQTWHGRGCLVLAHGIRIEMKNMG